MCFCCRLQLYAAQDVTELKDGGQNIYVGCIYSFGLSLTACYSCVFGLETHLYKVIVSKTSEKMWIKETLEPV